MAVRDNLDGSGGGKLTRTLIASNSTVTQHDIKNFCSNWSALTNDNFFIQSDVKGTGSVNTSVAGSGNFPDYWIKPRYSYNSDTGILTLSGMTASGGTTGVSRNMTAFLTIYLVTS